MRRSGRRSREPRRHPNREIDLDELIARREFLALASARAEERALRESEERVKTLETPRGRKGLRLRSSHSGANRNDSA
jgi:hypothetical protein